MELRESWYERRRERNRQLREMESDLVLEDKESLDLDLECGACGAADTYRLTAIAIDPDHESPEPYFVDEPPCTNCGETTHLIPMDQAYTELAAEALAVSVAEEKGQDLMSPLCFVSAPVHEGRKLSVHELFAALKERIAANPTSTEDLLSLANYYNNLGSAGNAEPYYRRALASNRTCAEAAIELAHIAITKGNDEQALELLQDAIDRRQYWTFYLLGDTRPSEFSRDLMDLYDEVWHRLGRDELPDGDTAALSEVRQTERVGRNQPCPCGSGKKYKRCCLGK
jgi:tetratricopeptide (TPR) repeat protein